LLKRVDDLRKVGCESVVISVCDENKLSCPSILGRNDCFPLNRGHYREPRPNICVAIDEAIMGAGGCARSRETLDTRLLEHELGGFLSDVQDNGSADVGIDVNTNKMHISSANQRCQRGWGIREVESAEIDALRRSKCAPTPGRSNGRHLGMKAEDRPRRAMNRGHQVVAPKIKTPVYLKSINVFMSRMRTPDLNCCVIKEKTLACPLVSINKISSDPATKQDCETNVPAVYHRLRSNELPQAWRETKVSSNT
jgi:hypothetical protein